MTETLPPDDDADRRLMPLAEPATSLTSTRRTATLPLTPLAMMMPGAFAPHRRWPLVKCHCTSTSDRRLCPVLPTSDTDPLILHSSWLHRRPSSRHRPRGCAAAASAHCACRSHQRRRIARQPRRCRCRQPMACTIRPVPRRADASITACDPETTSARATARCARCAPPVNDTLPHCLVLATILWRRCLRRSPVASSPPPLVPMRWLYRLMSPSRPTPADAHHQ